jgi:hypothetical protein
MKSGEGIGTKPASLSRRENELSVGPRSPAVAGSRWPHLNWCRCRRRVKPCLLLPCSCCCPTPCAVGQLHPLIHSFPSTVVACGGGGPIFRCQWLPMPMPVVSHHFPPPTLFDLRCQFPLAAKHNKQAKCSAANGFELNANANGMQIIDFSLIATFLPFH